MNEKTAGDLQFERYLRARGYAFEYEPDWDAVSGVDVATSPDYLIERDGARAACEVKEFGTSRIANRLGGTTGYAALSDRDVFGPVRAKVREGANNLRPLRECGLALVVVVTNPHGHAVHMGARDVMWAIVGSPVVVTTIDESTGAAVGDAVLQAGPGGSLMHHHRYVSGVVTIHEQHRSAAWRDEIAKGHKSRDGSWDAAIEAAEALAADVDARRARGEEPDGVRLWAHLFDSPLGEAVPIPAGWFDGDGDLRHGPRADGRYGRLGRP